MTATGPNVVFILADIVGVGDLSCYGGSVPTPRLDGLASQGMRFDNFNTEAQCTPVVFVRMNNSTGPMPEDKVDSYWTSRSGQ